MQILLKKMNEKIAFIKQEVTLKQNENDKYFNKKGDLETNMVSLNDEIGVF